MANASLLEAREDLASARSFRESLRNEPDASDRETMKRMITSAVDNASGYRDAKAAALSAEQDAAVDDRRAELAAENNRRLPESLRDEPCLSVRLRDAVLGGTRRRFDATLDLERTRLWSDSVLAGKSREELALVVGTDDKGGYWVPDVWETTIDSQYRKIEGITQAVVPLMKNDSQTAYVMTRAGNHPGASLSASSSISGLMSSEQAAAGNYAEGSYQRVAVAGHKIFQKVPCSSELLEDSGVDVALEVGREAGRWFSELAELAFTNGTGTSTQPKGAFHSPAAGRRVITEATGNPTMKDLSALVFDDDVARTAGSWSLIINREVWSETLADLGKADIPFQNIRIDGSGLMRAFGYPVLFGMFVASSVAANAYPAGFGQWNDYLKTRSSNIRMTASNVANSDTDEVVFRFRQIIGSALGVPDAAKFLRIKQ